MRKSSWTPSIVPSGDDHNIYLVLDDFGRNGRAWREADVEATDLETVIADLLTGQYKNPVRVIAFNTAEGWSQDVSADVAHELRRRCDRANARRSVLSARLCGSLRRPVSRRTAAAADAPGLIVAFQRKKPAAIGDKAPYPGFIEPELATSIEKVPSGERWIHEIKFDGYRVQVHLRERGGQGVHPARPRLDQSLQEDRGRRLAHQRGLRDHRWRGGRAGCRRHHGFLGAAKRTEGPIEQDRAGRLRSALPQRL